MLTISKKLSIALDEIDISAVRSQGAGGQNVNKVSSAVHLRFDIHASSLPQVYKQRMLASGDQRITKEGVVAGIRARSNSQASETRSVRFEDRG